MTKRQKLEVRRIAIVSRLNEIGDVEGEDYNEEVRNEEAGLKTELRQTDSRIETALLTEGAEEAEARGAFGPGDGEAGERGRLLRETRMAEYLTPALAGTGLTGRPAELNAALEAPIAGTGGGVMVPFDVLAGPELRQAPADPERRAFTGTTQNDGSEVQRPTLQRLFGPGVFDQLGVRVDTVPTGKSEWALISTGIAPAQAKEATAAAAAVAATYAFANLRPKRLTGVYELTHEIIASVADAEASIRRDLVDAAKSAMSNLLINGDAPTTQNPQNVEGFLTAITAPGNAGATAVYADYASAHAQFDGLHASTEREVSSAVGVDVLKHAASVFQAGSGESGSEAMERRSMSCMSSVYIPSAANSGQSVHNLFHLSGPNGGGVMRGDSVAAMWAPGLEIIRDQYTKASQGVLLTWVGLWDAKVAFRSAAYVRTAFDIT